MDSQSYTPDEFDNPPAGPVGVHRGPKSLWSRMVPYAVVVLVAAVCGLVVWTLTSGFLEDGRMPWQADSSAVASATSTSAGSPAAVASQSSSSTASAASSGVGAGATTGSASASPSASASSASVSSASASPSASASSSSVVNKSAKITVINGTSQNGYAAKKVTTLANAGYANASASNPQNRSTLPDASTVWYQNEADKATAQDVASRLGIGNVAQSGGIGTPIVVVLMK